MNNDVEVFLNNISEGAEPEKLESIIKTKTLIKEQADKIKATELLIEEKDNKLNAQDELIKKYEKMIAEHIKSIPTKSEYVEVETEEVSDYDELI